VVADRWLIQEELPMAYREQIVQFILQNTGQNAPVIDTAFSDPYTGGILFSDCSAFNCENYYSDIRFLVSCNLFSFPFELELPVFFLDVPFP
jgi:hypothetical protein